MNVCEICKKEHYLLHKITKRPLKYCSQKCALKKGHQNRFNDIERRLRHNEEERKRYRKKHNIKSEKDLKCAPKGSGTITKHGYKIIIKKGHPNSWKNGGIFEHVFIMSEYVRRPLTQQETVHHKNGIRNDNRIENLELRHSDHGPGQRIDDKIQWCKEFLNLYGYEVIKKEK